jgi:hypothetical protein
LQVALAITIPVEPQALPRGSSESNQLIRVCYM